MRTLNHDPLPGLLSAPNPAIVYFAARDLAKKPPGDPQTLWNLPEAQKILRKQLPNGSWSYPSAKKDYRSSESYSQTETFRNLTFLIEMFGFNRQHPAISKAAEFLLSFQTEVGDIRGILGHQYAPYYNGAILELLIKAGYGEDPRINKAFAWFASIRQDDGGWAIPFRTLGRNLGVIATEDKTLEPDRTKPSSHLVTGMVLRAYAAHERYRHAPEAKQASELLISRLFKPDAYADRRAADFWFHFSYPFWFTDLISALDALTLLGFGADEPQIARATRWLADRQQSDGLWALKAVRGKKHASDLWLSLAIARIMRRLER